MSDTQGADPLAMAERAMELAASLSTRQSEWVEDHLAAPADDEALDAAQVLTALAEAYKALHADASEAHKIIDRVWDVLGRPAYETLKGRTIDDLVKEEIVKREAAESECQRLREQLAQADAAQADALDAGRYTYKQLHKWKAESIARHRAARKRAEEDDHG